MKKTDALAAKAFLRVRCADDLALFSVLFFPHYCRSSFNDFHRDTFAETRLGERSVRRVRAAPRGYAKSTIKALIKPIHDVCYGVEDFIVVISNTQDQANGKLKDIRTEILTNDFLVSTYGIQFPKRTPGETAYEILCGRHACRFEAYGAGVEIRGIRYGAKRPTKIISDDSEHSEEVHNEEIRNKYEDWFFQVVSNIGTPETNIEFIGTVLHPQSLLMKLMKNPAYDAKIYKAVISWSEREDLWQKWRELYMNIDNGNRGTEAEHFFEQNKSEMLRGTKVLWPERESYLYLMKEMVEKGKRNFMKEKQNEPIITGEPLFEKIHWYRETDKGVLIESSNTEIEWKYLKHTAMGAMDPATGQTKAKKGKSGDYACILTGFQDTKGRLLVHHDWTKRAAPTKQISEIFDLHDRFKYQRFAVETNLYRNLMVPNIAAEKKRRELESKKEIQIAFYDVEQTDNKDKRIHTLEPKLTHGWILLNRALSQEFVGMIESYPKSDHDDGPDTLEMLWGLSNGRYQTKTVQMDVMGGR